MKKILFIISFIVMTSGMSQQTFAAVTPTPATGASEEVKEKLDKQINQLKEKIASRVSELNLVEKRGVVGTVEEVKGNQVTITDTKGDTRFIDVDELTKFSALGNKNFGLSDLTKGTKVSVLGNYNKQSKRTLGRFINTYTSPQYYLGSITAIDPKNYQITIQLKNQTTMLVDINVATTKITSYANAELVRYTFPKLTVGDKVFVVGNPDKTDPKMLVATRIIDFLELPKDTTVTSVTPTTVQTMISPTVLPTAAGNRRINPVR